MMRDEIWNQLVDAERLVRYYGDLAQHYNRCSWILRGVILLFCMAGITALLERIPEWANLIVYAVLAGAIVSEAIMNYEKKAALVGIIYIRCDKLLDQWRDLWNEIDRAEPVDEEVIQEKYRRLRNDLTDVTGWVALCGISEHKRIHKKATKKAYETIQGYYAHV